MKLKVLKASEEEGRRKITSFTVERLVIDAGNLFSLFNLHTGPLNLLLTHSHLDHIVDLPFFIDFTFAEMTESVKVYASKETISAVRENIFNGAIWPDLSELKLTSGSPVVEFVEIKEFEPV